MISVGRYGGGGRQRIMDDSDLEEGEARFYPDTLRRFDPDIDLAYIGDKLQACLGHFRKEFEGGGSAESLGSIYGGYGTFLPSYQRSPSVLTRPKSPPKVQSHNTPRCPNNLPQECVSQNGALTSNERLVVPSTSAAELPVPVASSLDNFSKGDSCLQSSCNTRVSDAKHVNVDKSFNPVNQKISKVRIKVRPSTLLSQRNAEILSGLGLDESPSSSLEPSPAHSQGQSPASRVASDLSPRSIIEDMTSFPIHGGCVLSPLPEDLLCLAERFTLPIDSRFGNSEEKNHLKRPSMLVQESSDGRNFKGNKMKPVEERTKELEIGNVVNAGTKNRSLSKREKDFETQEEKPWDSMTRHDVIRSEASNSKSSSACAEKIGEDRTENSHKDFQLDPKKGMVTKGDQRYGQSNGEFDGVKDRKYPNGGYLDPLKQKIVLKASTVQDQDDLVKPTRKEQQPSLCTNKSKETQDREFPKGRFRIGSSTVAESKKRSSGDYPSNGKIDCNKSHKDSVKKREKVDLFRGAEEAGKPYESLDRFVRDEPKDLKLDETQNRFVTEGPRDSKLDEVQPFNKKPKAISGSKKFDNSITSMAYPAEAPVSAPTGNAAVSTLGMVPAGDKPLFIEDWVCCDSCGTWRLLPFNKNANDLQQDQWVCRMLDWLPGMNRCDITEEETTRALYASYGLPVPGTQSSLPDAPGSGLNVADEQRLSQVQGDHNFPSMSTSGKKKNRFKEAPNADRTMGSTTDSAKRTSSDVKHSKLNEKRWFDEDGLRASKKFKSERLYRDDDGGLNADNSQGMGKLSSRSSNALPAKELVKDAKDCSDYLIRDSKSDGKHKLPSLSKKQKDQISVSGGAVDVEGRDKKDASAKKRKMEEENHSYPRGTDPSNGNCLVDKAYAKEINESEFSIEKKDKFSKSELKESSTSKGERRIDKRGRASQILASKSPVPAQIREQNGGFKKKDQPLGQYTHGNAVSQQTMDSSNSLRREAMAATSSSSKVSGSRKSKSNFQEVKGSPVESVSSSPFRNSNVDKVISARKQMEEPPAVRSLTGEVEIRAQGLRGEAEMGPQGFSPYHKERRDGKYSFKGNADIKSDKEERNNLVKDDSAGKRSSDYKRANQSKSGQLNGPDGKLNGSCSKSQQPVLGDHPKGSDVVRVSDALKMSKQPLRGSNVRHSIQNGSAAREIDAPNAVRKDASTQTADIAIKEAQDLKHKADRLKNSISDLEFITLYFEAALKFLRGASLLEPCNYDNSRYGEITRSLQLYGQTAKLCEFVAHEYVKHKEMAAAALAYKCMEVAYMRVVYSKSASINRDRLELQAAPPIGESPSSSASDVDNLNNQVAGDKVVPAKGVNTSQIPGNHKILGRTRPHFTRLLDHAQDVFFAMDASRNVQSAFTAATADRGQAKAAESIPSVKRVIDLNFHDVEGLLGLVRAAIKIIFQ